MVTSSDQIDASRITREQVTDPRYESQQYSGLASSEISDEDVGDIGSCPAWAGLDSGMLQDSSTCSGSSKVLPLTPADPEEGLGM